MAQNIIPVISIEQPKGLASRHSREQASLTVVNYTNQKFRVQWIDYDGAYQDRAPALEPFGLFTQNTFATHPFVLTDISGVVRHLVVPVAGDCIAYLELGGGDDCKSSISLNPESVENAAISRSLNSDAACLLTIVNKTDKGYRFIWLDFEGRRIEHDSVKPLETTIKCTFETHPWILCQMDSGRESLYFPQKGFCRIELND